MKRRDLIKTLEEIGCVLARHGGKHDWYVNPRTKRSQPTLRYLKQYLSISSGSYNRMWFHKRTSPKALLNLKVSPTMHDDAVALLDGVGVGYIKKPESFRITIDKKIVESKQEVFDKLVELVKRSVDGRG